MLPKTHRLLPLCLLFSCLTERPEAQPLLDLTQRLGPDEVLAGVVHDESALFGGISAEGQVGDIKIYNNRVRFIIQAVRESGYYIPYGGTVLDADIVRGFGQPGQDIIDDATIMVSFGSLLNAETVQIINDGTDGGAAIVRATGVGAPLELIGGAVENTSFSQARMVEIQTDYILAPDSPLLRIDTEARWMDSATTVEVSDIFFVAHDVAESFHPGVAPDGTRPTTYDWTGLIGQRNEIAMAIMQGGQQFVANTALDLISEIGPIIIASGPTESVSEGSTISASRYLGVAPDLATLTDAWHEAQATPTETVGGSVTASGYAVQGARVHVLDEDMRILTQAITGENGLWKANVAAGTAASVVATGRGTGVHYDLPIGAGWYSPYSATSVRLGGLAALNGGAEPILHAEAHGISSPQDARENTPLTLTLPGTLSVSISDGGPAVVRVDFANGDPETKSTWLTHERPSGAAAWLYIKDGYGEIPVEPGEYTVVVHRGARYDPFIRTIEVTGGQTTALAAQLDPVGMPAGIWAADPHAHASPSPDGQLPMEGRLLTHAAHGIDIHFGTDHDHIADYRVLLRPLGLQEVLASIVASEVSPPIRGHHNAYPLQEARDLPSNGGLPWWSAWTEWEGTADMFGQIRDLPSDGNVIVQANHPTGTGGLLGSAGHDPNDGSIAHPEMWSADFDAIEILNDGSHSNYVIHYLDLVNRGLNPVPTGVSDSHSHRGGVGQNMTWVPIDVAHMGELEPDHIRDAWAMGGTVPSTGPIIEARVGGTWAPGQTFVGTTNLDLTIWAPDWMDIARIHLRENGTVIDTIEATSTAPMRLNTSMTLNPTTDASYVIELEGDYDMSPVYPGAYPWAMTAAIRIDVDGNGWTPPLPSLRSK